ncbi:MAG: precorrin-8X methylmutase [Tepidanaerobacteraceae bacterium]|jgi:precorrin-8X/cobalt-precorrin-8 methylmutase|nr:precorrin-8X methylmutase [Tepidanaerobacteraceae bacterium]
MEYISDPGAIEKKSYEIIESHVHRGKFDEREWAIVRRVIHSVADFEYADIIKFSEKAVEAGLAAMRRGCRIVTDTRMAKAGISWKALEASGCVVKCYADYPEVASESRKLGITRAMASIMEAEREAIDGIFAIGNAPTALFKLLELAKEGRIKPDLVIGVPVGFVGAAESKEALAASKIPHIITRGRKGGSTVAVAIVNALLSMLENEN